MLKFNCGCDCEEENCNCEEENTTKENEEE
jgi:hypothetical protein